MISLSKVAIIRLRAATLLLTGAFLYGVVFASPARGQDRVGDCRIGIYQMENGEKVDIGATDGDHLRWRREDGTTGNLTPGDGEVWTSTLGWTDRPDGKRVTFDCNAKRITFAGRPGERIALDVTDATFQGAGARLAGRLVMPKGDARVPIVILVHGSEHFAARDFYSLQRQFPADGIGVFVYDKRGTGASGGRYTQDYLLLANDAIAAMNEARRLAGTRAGRIGYQAGSQGGWVAPLAANSLQPSVRNTERNHGSGTCTVTSRSFCSRRRRQRCARKDRSFSRGCPLTTIPCQRCAI